MRQRNIPWLGKLVDSLYTALPVLSILNFLSIITVLYASTREYLVTVIPWLNIGWFLLGLVTLTIITMVIIYVFVIPSLWTWRSKMMHGFDSQVVTELSELRKDVQSLKKGDPHGVTVAVSGGFDPLNGRGHATHIREARKLGDRLVVILSRDDQLVAKGNKPDGTFYPSFEDRKAILELVADEVVANVDKDLTSTESLRMVRPNIFAKGGDRTPGNMPESELRVCEEIGCAIVYGVGEPKVTSSSELIRRKA